MPKYYKIYDAKEVLYITVDDSGAVIIKDKAGKKIFLSKYQVKLMKFSVQTLAKDLFKDADSSDVHVEELKNLDNI